VYAYWFIFGDTNTVHTPAEAFDRRFRIACDIYNYGLGLALMERRGTNGSSFSTAPNGGCRSEKSTSTFLARTFPSPRKSLKVSARRRVSRSWVSVRNRVGGIGAPLIVVGKVDESLRIRRSSPATIFLRLRGSVGDLASGRTAGIL
jgi:hypothetical protein